MKETLYVKRTDARRIAVRIGGRFREGPEKIRRKRIAKCYKPRVLRKGPGAKIVGLKKQKIS